MPTARPRPAIRRKYIHTNNLCTTDRFPRHEIAGGMMQSGIMPLMPGNISETLKNRWAPPFDKKTICLTPGYDREL